MATVQLNVRVDAALVKRLRKTAKDRRQTPGTLVAQALEAFLEGPATALAADSSALAVELAALAQRVETLEQQRTPRPAPKALAEQQPAIEPPVAPPAGAITTVELAVATGTSKGAWNNWASKATAGDVRHHRQAGSWRLVGKAPGAAGGPARWLWEQAG